MLAWVLLWAVLVLAAGGVLGLLGWRLWQKLRALTVELGETSRRLTAVLATLNDVADPEQAAHRPSRSYDQQT
jgi:hypothetical protein